MLGLGLGLQYGGVLFAYDSQAVAHFNRVIADGGTIPAGLAGCDAWFKAIKGVYGVSDITAAISSGIHPHYLGYKAGAGSGATLGSAAQTCYNAIGSIGDVVQTTAASQPLILPHTGTNYVWLPGVASNNFTTPNATSNQITGDIDIKVNINYANNGSTQFLISKTQTVLTNHGYDLCIQNSNTLLYQQSRAGVFNACTSSVGIGSSFVGWVRVTRVSSTGVVTFFTSLDGINWTQLGSSFTLYSGALDNPNASVYLGSYFNSNNVFMGIIYRATISNTIDGNPVVDFNPASYSRATSATTWTSTTGEVWTINTPSTNNALKAAIVDTTYLMGNGTSIGMRAASLNINSSAFTQYSGFRKFVNSLGAQIITELGFISGNPGIGFYINDSVNVESIYLRGNVGIWQTSFTSTNLGLKLSTAVYNTANANECLPYLINNVAQTVSSTPATNNNSGTLNSTDFNLLGRANASSLWANVMFACNIITKQEDSTGTQTAMYTALKPFLVNAI